MKTIWKSIISGNCSIDMPVGATILCAREQHETPVIWYLCDGEAPLEKRSFVIFGTGHPLPENFSGKYIGTFFMAEGQLVFHVFEVTK